MRPNSFLIATMLSLAFASAESVEFSRDLPKSREIQFTNLDNKISILIDETCSQAFIKVIITQNEFPLLTKGKAVASLEEIESFLHSCKKELLETKEAPSFIKIFVSGNFRMTCIEEITSKIFSKAAFYKSRKIENLPISILAKDNDSYITIQYIPYCTLLTNNWDLQQFWITKCIEVIFQKRLSVSSIYYSSLFSSLDKNKLTFSSSLTASCLEPDTSEALEEFVLRYRKEKMNTITENELDACKVHILAFIEKLETNVERSDPSLILSLRNDFLEMGNHEISLKEFLITSKAIIQELPLELIAHFSSNLFENQQPCLTITTPVKDSIKDDKMRLAIGYLYDFPTVEKRRAINEEGVPINVPDKKFITDTRSIPMTGGLVGAGINFTGSTVSNQATAPGGAGTIMLVNTKKPTDFNCGTVAFIGKSEEKNSESELLIEVSLRIKKEGR